MRIVIAIIILVNWSAVPADAGPMCGKHADFVRALKDKYQETGKASGITGQIALVEIFAAKPGGTWTILVTTTEGKTCIIAAGSDWNEIIQEIRGEKL